MRVWATLNEFIPYSGREAASRLWMVERSHMAEHIRRHNIENLEAFFDPSCGEREIPHDAVLFIVHSSRKNVYVVRLLVLPMGVNDNSWYYIVNII